MVDMVGSRSSLFIVLLLVPGVCRSESAASQTGRYFAIEVVDDQTGRGVPMVELQTTGNVRYYTDSNGLIAFDEPGLMGRQVFFGVSPPLSAIVSVVLAAIGFFVQFRNRRRILLLLHHEP